MKKIYNERYEIIEKVGTGGMADVYKATDNVLERTVAVKVLHPQYASEKSFISRFKREAKAAANLNHHNIVNIYDWGQEGQDYYIVMEYLKGKNLKEIIAEKGKLNWRDAAKIGEQVAAALAFAHSNDVVHRDIKPHNIVISGNEVKVTDFGIARAGVSTMTQTGTILGTAHYISPEQARGQPADARSDIYSLGIVLFESVCGKMPFEAEDPVGIAMKHVNEAVPSMEKWDVPKNLKNVIKKALAKSPEERYQNAEELKEDLSKVLSGQNIDAVLPSEEKTMLVTPDKKSKKEAKKKRKKWPYVLTAIILLLLIAIGVYALFGRGKIIAVPDLIGKTETEAIEILEKKNLRYKITDRRYSDEYEKDIVINQDPEEGEKIREGEIIELVVSKGLEVVEIPDVSGQTRDEAEQTLLNAGLTLGKISYSESESPEGTVLSQDPEVGEEVVRSSAVNLIIAKIIPKVTVPNVVGRSRTTAKSLLNQAGLVASFSEQFSSTVSEGRVIDQNPSASSEANKGSTVVVYISKGREMVSVPNVVGRSKSSARSSLQNAGLRVSENGVGNTVNAQDPTSGTEVVKNSTVTIFLI